MTFAPSVVSPPCASNSAWNSSTIVPSAAMTGGRKMMAPSPVPVGCDELPVTDGNLMADSTNEYAPTPPSSSFDSGCFSIVRLISRAPWMTKGAATALQAAA